MQTVTHFLVTAFAKQQAQRRGVLTRPVQTPALLLGAVLPDIPFTLLSLGYGLYYWWLGSTPTGESPMVYMHFTLFFEDPLWIISHNVFHSLVINTLLLALGWRGMRRGWRWGPLLFWLAVGTQFHTLIDIVTHHSDGPLLFFPLNWSYRFPAPISYWEPDYYGPVVIIVENVINVLISGYFLTHWWRRRTEAN
ncbi:MAG: metal-dependent hydrolase [Chloroflexales bacterium]|nr:metal-dependent hydrolase [Chloroflexales bacterium]